MSNPTVETGMAAFNMARGILTNLLEDISEDQRCAQPVANGNHAVWIVGHLAWSCDMIGAQLAGKDATLPESWTGLFAWKTAPTSNTADYPTLREVKAAFDKVHDEMVAWYEGLSDEQLAAPVPDDLKDFGATRAALLGANAWHIGMHTGQLTVVRKALGLKPKFA